MERMAKETRDARVETKRTPAISTVWADDSVTFNFANGQSLTIKKKQLSKELLETAWKHGIEQKLRDAAALSAKVVDGRTVYPSVEEKFEAVKKVYDCIIGGAWNLPREPGTVQGGLVYAAISRVFPDKFANAEAFAEYVESRRAAQEKALGQKVSADAIRRVLVEKLPGVREAMEAIRAERGGAVAIDADAELEAFGQ